MRELNESSFDPVTFVLTGIPGMEESHVWISVPFCLMYLAAVFGNSAVLVAVATERSLHEPVYLFLAMLAASDLLLCTSTVPRMLAVFWFGAREISFDACVAQMFFTHFAFIVESSVLLAMAFDRYVAVCDPLRYAATLTPAVMAKMGAAAVARGFCIMLPPVFLLKRLPFCGRRVLPHSYCEHMGIARLACADIRANVWYGLATALLSSGLDAALIAASYALVLRAVLRLPPAEARLKALSTCGSHLCVILTFYAPAFFSFLTHRFGHHIPGHVHVLLADLYVVLPPVLNPLVYAARTRPVRERVGRLLRSAVEGPRRAGAR